MKLSFEDWLVLHASEIGIKSNSCHNSLDGRFCSTGGSADKVEGVDGDNPGYFINPSSINEWGKWADINKEDAHVPFLSII